VLFVMSGGINARGKFLEYYASGRKKPAGETSGKMDVSADFGATDGEQAHCVGKVRL
jgi:hypothetical protein